MIKVLWFLSVPAHLTLEQFEAWYLNTHTRIAKGMEGMMGLRKRVWDSKWGNGEDWPCHYLAARGKAGLRSGR
jgi:hypothetical protein